MKPRNIQINQKDVNRKINIELVKKIKQYIKINKKKKEIYPYLNRLKENIINLDPKVFLEDINEANQVASLADLKFPLSETRREAIQKISNDNIIKNILLHDKTGIMETKLICDLKLIAEKMLVEENINQVMQKVNRVGLIDTIKTISNKLLENYEIINSKIFNNQDFRADKEYLGNRGRLFQDTVRRVANYENESKPMYGTDLIAHNGKIHDEIAYAACIELNDYFSLLKTICIAEMRKYDPETPAGQILQGLHLAKLIISSCKPIYDSLRLKVRNGDNLGGFEPRSVLSNAMKEMSQAWRGDKVSYGDRDLTKSEKDIFALHAQLFNFLAKDESVENLFANNDIDTLKNMKDRISEFTIGTFANALTNANLENNINELIKNPHKLASEKILIIKPELKSIVEKVNKLINHYEEKNKLDVTTQLKELLNNLHIDLEEQSKSRKNIVIKTEKISQDLKKISLEYTRKERSNSLTRFFHDSTISNELKQIKKDLSGISIKKGVQ